MIGNTDDNAKANASRTTDTISDDTTGDTSYDK